MNSKKDYRVDRSQGGRNDFNETVFGDRWRHFGLGQVNSRKQYDLEKDKMWQLVWKGRPLRNRIPKVQEKTNKQKE